MLGDAGCDAGVGTGEATTRTHDSIAAGSGCGIYVAAAPDLVALRFDVEVGEAEPGDRAGAFAMDLDCSNSGAVAGLSPVSTAVTVTRICLMP
jgi:hypothetical protein